MLKVIIFDMDGVIVDTEYLDFQLQSELIKSFAKEPENLTYENFSSLVGLSGQQLLNRIKDLSQTDLPFVEIEAELEKIAQKKYHQTNYKDIFREDIVEILSYAKDNGIQLAVASSSREEHIREVLSACGIMDYFDLILSGEHFYVSKPDPAIYQAVLKKIGLQADQAVAIEDSSYGILAAKRAGLTVIAYEENRMLIDQSLADYKGKNMKEILTIIQQMA